VYGQAVNRETHGLEGSAGHGLGLPVVGGLWGGWARNRVGHRAGQGRSRDKERRPAWWLRAVMVVVVEVVKMRDGT
jgi:hypothetical protein